MEAGCRVVSRRALKGDECGREVSLVAIMVTVAPFALSAHGICTMISLDGLRNKWSVNLTFQQFWLRPQIEELASRQDPDFCSPLPACDDQRLHGL